MKKMFFLLVLFNSTGLFCQEGVWIYKKHKVIEKKKSSNQGVYGLTIDFKKNTVNPVYQDTIIHFKIDRLNSKMKTLHTSTWSNYKLYGKDSLVLENKESNNLMFFYPLKLNKKIKKSKEEVIRLLVENEFKEVEDSIFLNFKEEIVFDLINKRELITNYNNDKSSGGWFLREVDENFFLGFAFAPYVEEYNIYQITNIKKDRICLKQIIKTFYITDIKELVIKK